MTRKFAFCSAIGGAILVLVLLATLARNRPASPTSEQPSSAWPKPSDRATIGDITVVLESVGVDRVRGASLTKDAVSRSRHLLIGLRIINNSDTKKVTYSGWSHLAARGLQPRLFDDFGNSYDRVYFGIAARVEGQLSIHASIYPKNHVKDLLVFERPVEKADFVRLELPADRVGESGSFRFTIPATASRWR